MNHEDSLTDGSIFKSRLDKFFARERLSISVEPDNIFLHPYYHSTSFSDDIGLYFILFFRLFNEKKNNMRCICYIIIALIRLPEKVKFSNNIQPVRMPTTCNLSKTVEAIAMGYGDKSVNSTDKLNDLSRQLMFAELITLPTHVCREMLSFIFRDSMICAANELKKQSIFSGDSGGPIVMSGNHTLIGISSAVNIGTININLYYIMYSSFQ